MPITLNDVHPFFQVLTFRVPDGFNFATLTRVIVRHVNSKNASSYSTFEKQDVLLDEPNTHAVYYKHTQHPSWFKVDRAAPALEERFRNREFDLIILHLIDDYLFLHSSCRTLSDRVKDAILDHQVGRQRIVQPSPAHIRRVLNNSDLKLSSVAIDNVFGVGGTAAEGKAYYSPDAGNCLTVAFDSGYALKNFFGRDQAQNSKPIGASSTKRKVWKTWVDNIDAFKTECLTVKTLLETESATEKLPVLVQDIDAIDVVADDYLVFNMNCVVDEKIIRLKHNGITYGEWSADLHPNHNDRIQVTLIPLNATPIEIDYEFAFQPESHSWVFGPNGDEVLSIKFANEDGEEFANEVSLEEYLNQGTGFTFIFTEGRAFSNGSFTKNNRFTIPFARTDITVISDWSDVELTRESKDTGLAALGKITILEKARRAFFAMTPKFLIKDDGANEIADHVVIFDNKVILSHAKASKSATKGLRVDDLQVVCSQAVKCMRFFSFESYPGTSIERLYEKSGIAGTVDDFKASFESTFRSLNLEKECWIVQPGISQAELIDDPGNKIHTLLNYVDGICRSNGVSFRLICSS